MSIKDIKHDLQRAADRGDIQEHRVLPLTIAMVLEGAQQSFHMAYYGDVLDEEIQNVRAMDHMGKENAMRTLDHLLTDLSTTRRTHAETLTTSDFPQALAQARQRAQRDAYTLPESDLIQFAARRTAPNFKSLKAGRNGALNHRFMPIRPEATNIEYTNFFTTEEGYSVADYALALAFTWEAYINDDLGDFTSAAAELGVTARGTRAMVLMDAILRRAERIPLTDGEFGPTIGNLDQIADFMANRTDTVTGRRVSRSVSDLFVPTRWARMATSSMGSELRSYVGGANGAVTAVDPRNPVYQMATVHTDDLIADLLAEFPDRYSAKGISADDYVVMANGRSKPLELATLRGYEGGPKTFTRLVDVDETDLEGNFDNRVFAMKVHDVVGADLRDPYAVAIAQGD